MEAPTACGARVGPTRAVLRTVSRRRQRRHTGASGALALLLALSLIGLHQTSASASVSTPASIPASVSASASGAPNMIKQSAATWRASAAQVPSKAGKPAVFFDKWVINTHTLNPDCQYARPTALVNGQMPGPQVHVQEGTRVIIQVINRQKYPITIHWHGITQKGSQWYDGNGVTQCDLLQGMTYTYNFSTWGHAGTLWWHAHSGYLRNTVFGGLFVEPRANSLRANGRAPMGVPVVGTKAFFLSDWYADTPTGLATNAPGWTTPDAVLINGGSYFPSAPKCNQNRVFRTVVQERKWYRVRVVNAALFAAFVFAIQKHTIFTYEVEGGYLRKAPFPAGYTILSGQSYSFLFQANQKPGLYWIKAQPRFDAEGPSPALAMLQYKAHSSAKLPTLRGFISIPNSVPDQKIRTVAATAPPKWVKKVDRFIMLEMNTDKVTSHFSLNNVTLKFPNIPPLYMAHKGLNKRLAQVHVADRPTNNLWGYKGVAKQGFGVINVQHNSVVQLVIQNGKNIAMNPHPFHLHGFNFYVVGWGKGHFTPQRWNKYRYNLKNPVYRNTVQLDEASWVAVRFRADNIGTWLLHCHLEPHVDGGMVSVFNVKGNGKLPPIPGDYPACHGRALK